MVGLRKEWQKFWSYRTKRLLPPVTYQHYQHTISLMIHFPATCRDNAMSRRGVTGCILVALRYFHWPRALCWEGCRAANEPSWSLKFHNQTLYANQPPPSLMIFSLATQFHVFQPGAFSVIVELQTSLPALVFTLMCCAIFHFKHNYTVDIGDICHLCVANSWFPLYWWIWLLIKNLKWWGDLGT